MRAFVTGASGQIGLPLVRELVGQGHTVRALVRSAEKEEAVRSAGAEIIAGSMADRAALERGISGVDAVIHLAGGARGAGRETADVINRQATELLADVLRAQRAGPVGPKPNVVFASSATVYGDRSGLWVPEDFPTNAQTAYGKSKLAAEQALTAAGVPLVIARIAAVYGRGIRFTGDDRLKAGRGWLPGEGKNLIPLVHVDDCVAALIRIAERGFSTGGSEASSAVVHIAGKSTPLLREFYAEVHKQGGGTPMRFWSTWVPSVFQFRAAKENERLATLFGRKPRFTEDNLRIYTSSLRLRTDALEKQLGFTWKYADHKDGVAASVSPN
ncbi:MAG: NAD(P)-dependent oxidoreductase [Myxococcales bacterium]|nr:NAD(P)-dependent oxidoreductase [Myxococcales bacterium]